MTLFQHMCQEWAPDLSSSLTSVFPPKSVAPPIKTSQWIINPWCPLVEERSSWVLLDHLPLLVTHPSLPTNFPLGVAGIPNMLRPTPESRKVGPHQKPAAWLLLLPLLGWLFLACAVFQANRSSSQVPTFEPGHWVPHRKKPRENPKRSRTSRRALGEVRQSPKGTTLLWAVLRSPTKSLTFSGINGHPHFSNKKQLPKAKEPDGWEPPSYVPSR